MTINEEIENLNGVLKELIKRRDKLYQFKLLLKQTREEMNLRQTDFESMNKKATTAILAIEIKLESVRDRKYDLTRKI